MPHDRDGPRSFPPSAQTHVLAVATGSPADRGQTATRWSLDEIARVAAERPGQPAMSRSSVARILGDADIKPHRSRYWLNSHDPDFDDKAQRICTLYRDAPALHAAGEAVFSCDEKSGMQILGRVHPTIEAGPGRPRRIEHEYVRHGTRSLIATLEVATGRLITDLGPTRTSADFAAHLRRVVAERPDRPRYHWVVDNLNTHWSLDVCREVAAWCDIPFEPGSLADGRRRRAFLSDPTHRHVFYFTPIHGSWLNQVELWFSTLTRRFLSQGDFDSIERFESQLGEFVAEYNRLHARPYRWTYAGTPLVRGIPFSRTRAQERHGRALSSPRPPLYQRLLYPPRPYLRQAEAAAQGLTKS